MGFLLGAKKNIEKRERVIYNGNVTGDIVIDLFNKIKFYINEVNEMNRCNFTEYRRNYIEGMEYDYYYYVYSDGNYESNNFIDYRFGNVYTISECDDRVDTDGTKGKFVLNTKTVDCYSLEFKEIYEVYKTLNKTDAFRLIEMLKSNLINAYYVVNNQIETNETSLFSMIDQRIFNFNNYYTEMKDEDIIRVINSLNHDNVIVKVENNVYDAIEYDGDSFAVVDSFNGFYDLALRRGILKDNYELSFIMSNNKRMVDFIYKTLINNSLESYLEMVNSSDNEYRKAVVEISSINYIKNNDFARYNIVLNEIQKEIFEFIFQNGLNKLPPSNKEVKEKKYVKRI